MSVQGKEAANGTYEFDYLRKPDSRSGWQGFRDWIYNPRKGTILDRNAHQWGVVGLFYLVFYSVLAVLCAICFWGLMASLDDHRPTYTLERSIIGTNPGLGFRPISNDTKDRALIWYDAKNETQIDKWTTLLDEFLDKYRNRSKLVDGGMNQMHCDYNRPPVNGKVCIVDLENYGECTSKNRYGFKHSQPCIFIKLNKIFDWMPEYYNDTENLPADMPQDLQNYVKSLKNEPEKLNTVWLSCNRIKPRANETIQVQNKGDATDDVIYYPKTRGFPGYYYPYANQREYLSPIVAIQFTRLSPNDVVRMECQAWAKNIIHKSERGDKSGAVRFELKVD